MAPSPCRKGESRVLYVGKLPCLLYLDPRGFLASNGSWLQVFVSFKKKNQGKERILILYFVPCLSSLFPQMQK